MQDSSNIKNRVSSAWELDKVRISHNLIDYKSKGKQIAINQGEYVRLHFGLKGSYDFTYKQLNSSYSLSGHHNNIMYSNGLEIEVENKSDRIETFGIDFHPEAFIEIGQHGNEPLKRFTEQVLMKRNSILSSAWKTNNFKIQQVIQEIIHCSFTDELKDLFLWSKSIELLVLQAELYDIQPSSQYIKSSRDKRRLIEAKELISSRIDNPPTIVELSKLVGINEYKLKKGFKELFGTTIFGYIHNLRMSLAKKLLLGTDKTAKEIAFETGYSSPQHFSNAFKKKFGVPPKSVRNTPDHTIEGIDNSSNLSL